MSPLYPRLEEEAVWGASMGYERPLYFHKSQDEAYGGVSPGGVVEHTLYGDVVGFRFTLYILF